MSNVQARFDASEAVKAASKRVKKSRKDDLKALPDLVKAKKESKRLNPAQSTDAKNGY